MSLPDLKGWEKTRDALHQASAVLGAIRVAGVGPEPNDLHYSLAFTDEGATTGVFAGGNELQLSYGEARVRMLTLGKTVEDIALSGHNQTSLFESLVELLGRKGTLLEPDREKIVHDDAFAVDLEVAAGYAAVQRLMGAALTAFKKNITDETTRPVLWPHHFDLAFLRFPGDDTDEKKDPQLGTGFAPMSDGIPDPYLYVYASPMPEDLLDTELPAPARWVTEGFTGVLVDYTDLAAADDPEALIVKLLKAVHGLILPKMAT